MSFKEAVSRAKTLPITKKEDMLRVYSAYKCATLGVPTIARPSMWDPVARMKWDSWTAMAANCTDKDEAKKIYVSLINDLSGDEETAPAPAVAPTPAPTSIVKIKRRHEELKRLYEVTAEVSGSELRKMS